jgi:hypothetical protein
MVLPRLGRSSGPQSTLIAPWSLKWLLCAVLGGCATSPRAAPESPPTASEAFVPTSPAPPPAPPIETSSSKDDVGQRASPPRTILRSQLTQVLNRSPAYFLSQVQTEPRFVDGRFRGWKLVSFFPGDARFAGVDVRPGDVITRINGRPIEQPDQFMLVWDRLRVERELVLEFERDGTPRTLRWTIADK